MMIWGSGRVDSGNSISIIRMFSFQVSNLDVKLFEIDYFLT